MAHLENAGYANGAPLVVVKDAAEVHTLCTGLW